MKITKQHLIASAIVIIVAGVSFYSGTRYQATQGRFDRRAGSQFMMRPNGNQQGSERNNAGKMGMRPIAGEIISQDDKTMTIKLADGNTKLVILSEQSQISKATTGTKNDLIVGQQAMVFGAQNSDGSVTAQTISVGIFSQGMPASGTTPSGKVSPSPAVK